MTPLVPAIAGALVLAGLIGLTLGLRPAPPPPPTPRRARPGLTRIAAVTPRTRALLLTGLTAGVVVAVLTGWWVAALVLPAAAAGLPVLLSAPPSTARIDRLEAMEEWTRALSGVLTVGVGLEQALLSTLRSTPQAIRPEVTRLVSRLRARWATEDALRAFADDLDDATGDLVVAALILGSRRRGPGLARVLAAVADSVADDVAMRRKIEAERAKPRTTARAVTLITVAVLAIGMWNGTYLRPYGTALGQLVLLALAAAFVGALAWMRALTLTPAAPRLLGPTRPGRRP